MHVLQITNIVSHHQLPLARCLAKALGADDFRFAVTEPVGPERLKLGWSSQAEEPWILQVWRNRANLEEFEEWWNESDVVLCGQRLLEQLQRRVDRKRLTFYMSERWWKPPIGMARLLYPKFARMVFGFRKLALSSFFHFLPAGYYSAADMKKIARFSGRMWRWGYFTTIPDPLPRCAREGQGLQVLWVGRMLKWKQVGVLLKAFCNLLPSQPHASITLVGDGPERKRLQRIAQEYLPVGNYRFLPPQPSPKIHQLMNQHHVYVLPSNAYEGWGAVINEAMAEGCAVIASDAAGAAKSMIRTGENGFLFAPGDWKKLSELLRALAEDEVFRLELAEKGQRTITECWSPAIAAKRFLSVSEAFLSRQPIPIFDDGPMAPT